MGRDPTAILPVDPLLQKRFVLPLLEQLRRWETEARGGRRRLPVIGLNGPVGAGKSTLGRQLERLAAQFGLRLLVASIDDLYLGWPERGERLAGNPFGVSRVPPGSHDLPLLLEALAHWRQGGTLTLPRFDKTLADGQGDRSGWREQACVALVLEGWLMGCRPLPELQLTSLMEADPLRRGRPDEAPPGAEQSLWSAAGTPPLQADEWRWLPRWNRELEAYLPLWQALDGLWLLRPLHWGLPRRWRFQAEARQRRAGGGWLPANELERLVRASLCSLPPDLYQDPLTRELAAAAETLCWQVGEAPNRDSVCQGSAPCSNGRPEDALGSLAEGVASQDKTSDQPPVQGLAWLDGRRRCRSVWLQASLSASSSATG